jgi:formylglycine-generating enzyme required for sulfatase activity
MPLTRITAALIAAALAASPAVAADPPRVPAGCAATAPAGTEPWNGTGLARAIVHPPSGIDLLLVPAHAFRQGSPDDEPGRERFETPHRTTLSAPFYLGRTEVTRGQWERIMGTPAVAWIRAQGGACRPRATTARTCP